ncbi:hypothetical protein ACHAQH_007434 [Verticillium albo-atrum]
MDPESSPPEGKASPTTPDITIDQTSQAEPTSPEPQPLPLHPDDPNALPAYEQTANDTTTPLDFLTTIDAFIAAHPDLVLPISTPAPAPTRHSGRVFAYGEPEVWAPEQAPYPQDASPSPSPETHRLRSAIVYHFFTAISSRQDDVVRLFVTRGLVSPDVPSVTGETPLLAAVRAGDGATLCALVALGAKVDGYGTVHDASEHEIIHVGREPTRRTPLQYAAALGRLPLVKVLIEDFHADDALVAPDGEIALRLAAKGRHRDVVAYLPARRAGAALRVKTALRRGARRVWRVLRHVGLAFYVLLWECPKMLTYYPLRAAWRARHRFAGWAKRQAKEMPKRVVEEINKTPRRVVECAKAFGRGCKVVGRAIKRAPGAVEIFFAWIWKGIKGVWGAVAEAAKRVVGVLHTAFAAVVRFFRGITLKDVWDGIVAACRAVFVALPMAVWRFLGRIGEMSWDVLVKLAGTLGKIAWFLLWCLVQAVVWLPKQGWKIVVSCGRVISTAFEEVLVLLNPKRLS